MSGRGRGPTIVLVFPLSTPLQLSSSCPFPKADPQADSVNFQNSYFSLKIIRIGLYCLQQKLPRCFSFTNPNLVGSTLKIYSESASSYPFHYHFLGSIISHLNYCSSLITHISNFTLKPLSSMFNKTTGVFMLKHKSDHVVAQNSLIDFPFLQY